MKNGKNNLDEMQEAKLLQIEHNGCWLAFWGLLAAMIVELFVFKSEELLHVVIGEWVVFMALCLYIGIACLKNGVWDRRLKAAPGTNLIISLIAALATALIMGGMGLLRSHSVNGAFALFVLYLVGTFVVCFAALSLAARAYKKKLSKLESEGDENSAE